jgi:hypothetical protein
MSLAYGRSLLSNMTADSKVAATATHVEKKYAPSSPAASGTTTISHS